MNEFGFDIMLRKPLSIQANSKQFALTCIVSLKNFSGWWFQPL